MRTAQKCQSCGYVFVVFAKFLLLFLQQILSNFLGFGCKSSSNEDIHQIVCARHGVCTFLPESVPGKVVSSCRNGSSHHVWCSCSSAVFAIFSSCVKVLCIVRASSASKFPWIVRPKASPKSCLQSSTSFMSSSHLTILPGELLPLGT